MDIQIRRATEADAVFLTSISFGVRYYEEGAENDIRKWYDHLNITKDYIKKNNVFVALNEGTIIGYCGMRHIDDKEYTNLGNLLEGDWVEYLFVRPAYIKMGVGSKLMKAIEGYCRENNIQQINIMSDSIFNGFYEKIGADYVNDIAIAQGEKKISWYKYVIHQEKAGMKEETALENPRLNTESQETRTQDVAESAQDIADSSLAKEESLIQEKLSELDKGAEEDNFYDDEETYEEDEMPYEDDEETDERYRFEDQNQDEWQERKSNEEIESEEDAMQNEYLEDGQDQEIECDKEAESGDENEFADKLSYEKFVSETVPIGYKFECEELAENATEEAEDKESETESEQPLEECKKKGKITGSEQTETTEIEQAGTASENNEQDEQIKQDKQTKQDKEAKQEEQVEVKEDAPLDDKTKADYTEVVKQLEQGEEWVAEECTSLNEKGEEVLNHLAPLSKAELEVLVGSKEENESSADHDIERSIDSKKSEKHQMISIERQEADFQLSDDEKKKMIEGELYIAWGDDIVNDRRRARRLLKEFNSTDPEDKRLAHSVLQQLLGKLGEYVHIEPTFRCSYGYNISVGENFYASYDCIILDQAKVTIGDNCILSPKVGIYTLSYPLEAKKRISGYQYARPITIGNNVWIGSGAIINPGVTIGDNAVIESGAVVNLDIPNNVLVGGNPAKIIRELSVQEAQN